MNEQTPNARRAEMEKPLVSESELRRMIATKNQRMDGTKILNDGDLSKRMTAIITQAQEKNKNLYDIARLQAEIEKALFANTAINLAYLERKAEEQRAAEQAEQAKITARREAAAASLEKVRRVRLTEWLDQGGDEAGFNAVWPKLREKLILDRLDARDTARETAAGVGLRTA